MRPSRSALTGLLAAAVLLCCAGRLEGGRRYLPADFDLPVLTHGGAGGGEQRAERTQLRHVPLVMVAGLGRDHHDWLGRNPGNAPVWEEASVYDQLLAAGFAPIELWMIDFARAGDQMTSLEEATDDLKMFIAEVMRYTGANRVQIVAHDTGCLQARLAILKYNLGSWIESEVYIAGPFHGVSPAPDARQALRGRPNAWVTASDSDLLREITFRGESPILRGGPLFDQPIRLRTMTIRNGLPGGDPVFTCNPDSPELMGALNLVVPGLDHDGLRCSAQAVNAWIPFVRTAARPYDPDQDRDRDGFRARALGGPDCDDDDATIFPGAREIKGDGIDQDCNGCDYVGGRDGELLLSQPR